MFREIKVKKSEKITDKTQKEKGFMNIHPTIDITVEEARKYLEGLLKGENHV